jgi:hypothetical protein
MQLDPLRLITQPKMTLCVVLASRKTTLCSPEFTIHDKAGGLSAMSEKIGGLFSFDGGGIDEHDRDVILDGVHAVACATFQAVPLVERHRLFANRANQQIKKVLGNHGENCSVSTVA